MPHGAPVALGAARAELAAGRRPRYVAPSPGGYERIDSRFLLSTFGLISPGKGLETMIEALPAIVERHPEVLYVIAGRTHPQIARRQGEEYRLMLERRIVDLGLEDHVEFDDRFLSVEELADLLAATDVFVTPYTNREQSSSGALTFALAAGCAVVSTPFLYAEDMLRSGAGTIVPFGDAAALAAAVCALIEHPDRLDAARTEARRVGSGLAWPSVAEATASVLDEAAVAAPRRTPIPDVGLELVEVRTNHLRTLSTTAASCSTRAARFRTASRAIASTTSPGSSSSRSSSRAGPEIRPGRPCCYRSLAFLADATDEDGAGMRNFMSYDRRWLDEPHVGDHVGRSIWALGDVLSTAWVPAVVGPSQRLLASLVRSLQGDLSIRTAAYATLGLARLDADRLDDEARELLERCVDAARGGLRGELGERLALVRGRTHLRQRPLAARADRGRHGARPRPTPSPPVSSRWRGSATSAGSPTGTCGCPATRDGSRDEPAPGAGDEQPLDASAFVEAELAAFAVTGDPDHGARAQRAFEWFLGRNRLGRPLYDFATGGCCDGLSESDVNENEGAESTLAFHRAQLVLDAAGLPRVLRRRAPVKTAA